MRYVALNPVRVRPCPPPGALDVVELPRGGRARPAPPFLNADWLRSQFSSVAELERFVLDGLKPLPSPIPWR